MQRLEHMKETLMNSVQSQLGDLASVDAKELGEAVDMIKDLAEAIYYCQIVEAMKQSDKEKDKEKHIYHYEQRITEPRMYERDMGRMYYPMEYNYPTSYENNGRRNYMSPEYNYANGGGGNSGGSGSGSGSSSGSRNYSTEYPIEIRDYREGRSGNSRRNYMESKEMHKDKTTQMHELEKYMQELSSDITEMIEGASPEEKQMLQKKLSVLATKVV